MASDGESGDNWCTKCQEHCKIYDDELLSKEELAKQFEWSYELWEGKDRLSDENTDTYYWYDEEGNAYSEEEFNNLTKEDICKK